MAVTSLRQFQIDLYEEHLDEAGFLWEQTRAVRRQPDLPWTHAGSFEERLEAQLDALVVGGDVALEVCQRRAADGEPGELFAALCVVCRHGNTGIFAPLLRSVDYAEPERTRAVLDALKYQLPDAWTEHCVRAVGQAQGPLVAVLAGVIGYRRLAQSDVIVDVAQRVPDAQRAALLWAIGRTRPAGASRAIRPALASPEPSVRDTAFRAGLRVHAREVRAELFAHPDGASAQPIALGLCGDRSTLSGFLAASRHPDASPDVAVGLGLLGDLAGVRLLVELLTVAPMAQAAAEALYVITGAPLFSDVQIQDEMTEDEMFEAERTAFRKTGARPGRGDGMPYVTTVRQLAADPGVWEAWLQANVSRFKADRRYRVGRECSPHVLLDCLDSETFPKSYRGLVADELLIRYGIDVPFEPDLPVVAQRRTLTDAAGAVRAGGSAFEPGRWYCFGAL